MTPRILTRSDYEAILAAPFMTRARRMLIQDRVARGEWVITDQPPMTPARATATA